MKKIKRYLILFLASILLAVCYNVLILPNTMVTGGVSGLGVVMQDFINPGVFIFLINILLIILSMIVLGIKRTKDFILGALLFPVFVYLTSDITKNLIVTDIDMILLVIVAAVIAGFSIGIIIKNGFSTGGVDIAACIFSKIFNRSIGNSFLVIDGLIVLAGAYRFGLIKMLYAIIFIYILSTVVDRIILGISSNKAFYIVTSEEEKVKNFILNDLGHGASVLKAKGGYHHDRQNLLFCVVPSSEYFKLKEGIMAIDEKAFFMVTDAYEVQGGA